VDTSEFDAELKRLMSVHRLSSDYFRRKLKQSDVNIFSEAAKKVSVGT
jgi:hypothetical protein